MSKSITQSATYSLKLKLTDYHQLAKTRLTLTVVISAVLGYLIAVPDTVSLTILLALSTGGFLVVASANALNQVIEKNYDSLMERTLNRPVAQNRMSVLEASLFAIITGILGVTILGIYLNSLSASLGLIALLSYAFLYTPLKRMSPWAVFVGAIPGAIPPLIGWTAATASIDQGAIVLFAIQFIWQFPHFWSIAWILDDDYQKAGYRLLPDKKGRSLASARMNFIFSLILLGIGFVPYFSGMCGVVSTIVIAFCGLLMVLQSYKLLKSFNNKDAKRLMFLSILYNPVVLIALMIDKI